MADSYLKQSDTHPVLTSTLRDVNGDPVNIQGATVTLNVRLMRHWEEAFDLPAEVDQVGTGTDGTKGQVSHEFATPLDAGGYLYEWRVEYAGGEVEHFPNDGYLSLAVLPTLEDQAS